MDSLFYDALGRRVAKQVNGVTTWYVYDGDQVVMDVDSLGALSAEYAYRGAADLLGIRTPTDTLVALSTATNGTIVGMAQARNGAEVKRYPVLNTPWSQQTPDTGLVVRFRMGGQEYDQETGLYHLGARYYDPQIGRFLSEDPIGIAGGLNLYVYANNNPVSGRDPSGLDGCYVIVHIHWEYDEDSGELTWRSWTVGPFCPGSGGGGGGPSSGSRGDRNSGNKWLRIPTASCSAPSSWPHGLGVALDASAAASGPFPGSGAAASGELGGALFWGNGGVRLGGWASTGGTVAAPPLSATAPGGFSPNSSAIVVGTGVSAGPGIVLTNARGASEMRGPFSTVTAGFRGLALTVEWGGGIWSAALSGVPNPISGFSATYYQTSTFRTVGGDGCRAR